MLARRAGVAIHMSPLVPWLRSSAPESTNGDVVSDGLNLLADSVQEPFSAVLGLLLMKCAPLLFCIGWTLSFL